MVDTRVDPDPRAPALFISYRRADTQSFARDLHRRLAAGFGYERVFMDRAEIRPGERWAERLDEELARSTVVLALIGPQWLSLLDEDHRRRIDGPNDWVRRELSTALAQGKEVIPIYVGGARTIDEPRTLPTDLSELPGRERIVLTDEAWNDGMASLARRLRQLGLHAAEPNFRMPTRLKNVSPLSVAQIEQALKDLPSWRLTGEERRIPHAEGPVPHSELYREYAFNRFEDATAFMAETSPEINRGQHHPRWENLWTTVRVWLSTWDIEFHPSAYDVKLAKWLDAAYIEFKAGRRAMHTRKAAPGGAPPDAAPRRLDAPEIERLLALQPRWALVDDKLERTLRFRDFASAFGFMSSVAIIAEALGHHPEWFNVGTTVKIMLTTHDVRGLSARDFQLAQRIDALAPGRYD